MLSSDTDSSDLADWEWLQPGDVYEEGKHYTLITEFYYEEFGARPDRFLTNSSYDVIATKTVNGKANNDDAVEMYLNHWEYKESHDNAIVAYQWKPSAESAPVVPAPEIDTDFPKTGDDSNIVLWSALACISLFGMMTHVRKRKEA